MLKFIEILAVVYYLRKTIQRGCLDPFVSPRGNLLWRKLPWATAGPWRECCLHLLLHGWAVPGAQPRPRPGRGGSAAEKALESSK